MKRLHTLFASTSEANIAYNRFSPKFLIATIAMHYFWQTTEWPSFKWNIEAIYIPLAAVRKQQGLLLGSLQALGFDEQLESFAHHLTADVSNTAAIEGEHLDPESIRSSVARHLGLPFAGLKTPSHSIDNQVEILLDATHTAGEELTQERLFSWHRALFPTGSSGLYAIHTGCWREDEMQVVSGAIGRETVHFEAPPPKAVPLEMARFLTWWNIDSRQSQLDGLIRAAVAHLYFVTIHPFDDGNGRITRALTDRALAEDDHFKQRYYSLSATIMAHRSEYYDQLQSAQHGTGDITPWLLWFIHTVSDAVSASKQCLRETFFKAHFWQQHAEDPVSPRQKKVINRLFDAGKGGFKGGLSTRKYQSLTSTSRATAWRELNELVHLGLLRPIAGASGRSTAYEIPWPDDLPSRTAA